MIAYWIATFFGSGLVKKAPGTFGSLASLFLWAPLVMLDASWPARLACVVVVTAIGFWACEKALPRFTDKDPKQIVIDEVAGQGVALLFCGPAWINIAVGFLLFRLFDIWKPWPIGWIDQKLSGSTGIMLDDLLAGAFAAIGLYLIG